MAYSGSMTASACATDPALELNIPRGRTGSVQILVGGGQDLSNRFAWRGRASRSTEAGLFLVALNADGHIQAQSFVPEQVLIELGRKEIPRDIVEVDPSQHLYKRAPSANARALYLQLNCGPDVLDVLFDYWGDPPLQTKEVLDLVRP